VLNHATNHTPTLAIIHEMIKIKNILTIALVTLLLFGCGEYEPNVAFEEPIKGQTINLSNRVGDSFQIIRDNDTIRYSLYFDKSTNFNYLVKPNNDTVFIGTVTKRKELFLLSRLLKSGKFAIHALKFTDSTVTGLETEWLQSIIINKELANGKYTNLITDTVGITTINAKKKDGKEIFRDVIKQLEAEKLIVPKAVLLTDHYEEDYLNIDSDIHPISKAGLIKKVYPNPFTDNITVELTKKAPYVFIVNDLNGKRIKTSKLNTDKIKIDLPNLKPGFYTLNIVNIDFELVDKIKLVKK
jgi:hypothetical protein